MAPGPVDGTGYAESLKQYFGSVRAAAIIGNRAAIHNQEWSGRVYICAGLKRPWGKTWTWLRHYG